MTTQVAPRDLFERYIQYGPGCWEWQGARTPSGYGAWRSRREPFNAQRAHRWAWWFKHGEDPGELVVCHHCDNPPCVRPSHLFLGTQKQNVHDMYSKSRSRNRRPLVTEAEKADIRKRLTYGVSGTSATRGNARQLAEEFGLTYETLLQIAHVPGRTKGYLTRTQESSLTDRYLAGETQCKVGAEYGLSRQTTSAIVKRELARRRREFFDIPGVNL